MVFDAEMATMPMCVYIMSSTFGTLYVGVTNNLERRVYEHKHKLVKGFTTRYNVHFLVYYETWESPVDAIAREKQIKAWRRERKVALIEEENSQWRDLSADW